MFSSIDLFERKRSDVSASISNEPIVFSNDIDVSKLGDAVELWYAIIIASVIDTTSLLIFMYSSSALPNSLFNVLSLGNVFWTSFSAADSK